MAIHTCPYIVEVCTRPLLVVCELITIKITVSDI